MDREKTSGILRIVAGGYLLYIAYNLFKSVRSGQPGNYTLMIAFSILFVILGGIILYMGIKGMMQQGKFVEGEDSEAIEGSENQIESSEIAEEAEIVEAASREETASLEETASPEETASSENIKK